MLRWLRRLLYRSGAPVTPTTPSGFREGDAILRPDGWYEWVDGHFQPMKPDKQLRDPDRLDEEGWEARMAERAAAHHAEQDAAEQRQSGHRPRPDRSTWPVPERLKGYSARDVFLWYVCDGWSRILGGEPKVLFDHDFGWHVLSDGIWQLTLVSLDEFPDERFKQGEP